jgi:hypothetical protein
LSSRRWTPGTSLSGMMIPPEVAGLRGNEKLVDCR